MRTPALLIGVGLIGLMAAPAGGTSMPQGGDGSAVYRVDVDKQSVFSAIRAREGQNVRLVGLQFQIKRLADQKTDVSVPAEEIRVLEDGKEVLNLQVLAPSRKLSVVLA